MSTIEPTAVYGFSNVDMSKQIVVAEPGVFAGISRANQTISIYHGETLIIDSTMPSAGLEYAPTVVRGERTLHDETFTGFVHGEAYTIVAADEPPIAGFVLNKKLFSFDPNAIWDIFPIYDRVYPEDCTASRTSYSVSQKITTTKKRYDIKLLPEELLPKTAAKKAEVRKAQQAADVAQARADRAYDYADEVYGLAVDAGNVAETAQTTAESAVKAEDGYRYSLWSNSANHPYPAVELSDYSQYRSAIAMLDESVGLVLSIVRDGGISNTSTVTNPATIKVQNNGGSGGVVIDGLRSLIMTSSTPNSTKKFRLAVDDSGTISATEVTE